MSTRPICPTCGQRRVGRPAGRKAPRKIQVKCAMCPKTFEVEVTYPSDLKQARSTCSHRCREALRCSSRRTSK